jgi:hypothetical protein
MSSTLIITQTYTNGKPKRIIKKLIMFWILKLVKWKKKQKKLMSGKIRHGVLKMALNGKT